MPIFLPVKLGRPGVPGFQVEEGFEGRIRDAKRLDPILLDAQQPQGKPVAGLTQLPVEIALEDLAILEANRHLSLCARPLLRAGFAGGQRNSLDRGQRDERTLVIAGLIRHLKLDIRLIQAYTGHLALHDLVVKKSDGDGGGFSGPRTAHLWPSLCGRQRHYNEPIAELLRKDRGRVTKLEIAAESRATSARTGAMIRPATRRVDFTSMRILPSPGGREGSDTSCQGTLGPRSYSRLSRRRRGRLRHSLQALPQGHLWPDFQSPARPAARRGPHPGNLLPASADDPPPQRQLQL